MNRYLVLAAACCVASLLRAENLGCELWSSAWTDVTPQNGVWDDYYRRTEDPANCSFRFRVMRYAAAIGVEAFVRDDKVVVDNCPTNSISCETWKDDCLEVFFDGDDDRNPNTRGLEYETNPTPCNAGGEYAVAANGSSQSDYASAKKCFGTLWGGTVGPWSEGGRRVGTHYRLWFRYACLNRQTPRLDEPVSFGFTICVHDDDDGGANDLALYWKGNPKIPYADESAFGRIVLPAVAGVETAKWQGAIDAAAARGGGRVTVPAGVHRVGGLLLRSNVELHLEAGAELNAVTGMENYRRVELPYSEGVWSAVVMGVGVTNVAVTGTGVINGRGGTWPEPTEEDFKHGCQEGLRPRGLFFSEAKDIRLSDFTLKDSACWGIVLKACDGVVARRVKIDSHANWNNDGFDLEARNVLIEDCEADTGDDAFCIKSNDPKFVCENIVFRRCTARGQANAFKIGTATHGLVRNVRYENVRCDFGRRVCTKLEDGTPMKLLKFHYMCDINAKYPTGCMLCGLAFECVDGGAVEDIVVDGLELVGGVREPIFIRSDLRKVGRHSVTTAPNNLNRLRNIRISNVRGRAMGPYASAIVGVDGFRIENVFLKDIDITVEGAGAEASRRALETPVPYKFDCYPSPDIFWPHFFPAYGLYADRADNVTLENVTFRMSEGTEDARPAYAGVGR